MEEKSLENHTQVQKRANFQICKENQKPQTMAQTVI